MLSLQLTINSATRGRFSIPFLSPAAFPFPFPLTISFRFVSTDPTGGALFLSMDPGGIGIGAPPPPPLPPSSRASLPLLSRLLPLPEAATPPPPPSMDRRAPPDPPPLGRCALPRRCRREIRLAGPPRARPSPLPLGSASLGCAAGMSGAAGRRREAVPRAGGGGRFFLYIKFFYRPNFLPKIFFLLILMQFFLF